MAVLSQGCVKDLQDEINNGNWNHERQVLEIKFENQVGLATIETIDATSGTIDIAINVGAVPDLSDIRLESMLLSYQATASIKPGDALNFENPQRAATMSVTSTTGETRVYTVHVNEFTEDVTGSWTVEVLTVYGGTGPEYGGGAIMPLADKPWCWNEATGPMAECDNILTFTLEGVTDEGNTYGTCVNNPGADGKYFDAIYIGNNPESGQNVDLRHFFRQIPEGESKWTRDYSSGTISFTDKDGRITTGAFVGACTEDMGYDKTFTITDNAFEFNLNGTDDWTNIYTDYDKFVKKPRKFWITVKKQ
ncbi:MAG: hypothetical protein K2L80_00015 [Muribaculaceae bacterium]|nr:hypothetical protein [Muribaculaceae bacterium]